jgi:MFS family permease
MDRFSGLFGFTIVAFGQVVSLLGSSMTAFALTIWAWRITGQATALGLVNFAALFPLVILSPLAGALVDRWNRKLVMILSDLGAGIGTVALFILLSLGTLEIWHIYIVAAFMGASQAFQFPAYSASITLMVPKEHLSRANAMLGIARSIPSIFAPMAAGALIGLIDIQGMFECLSRRGILSRQSNAPVSSPTACSASGTSSRGQAFWACFCTSC